MSPVMSSLSTNHALSVFTNSCRSKPTSVVRDRDNRPGIHNRPRSVPIRDQDLTTKLVKIPSSRPRTSQTRTTKKGTIGGLEETRSSHHRKTPKSADIDAKANLKQSSDYETLFQTLLESNTLLHKEVCRLKREHHKTMSKLMSLNQERSMTPRRYKNLCDKSTMLSTQSLPSRTISKGWESPGTTRVGQCAVGAIQVSDTSSSESDEREEEVELGSADESELSLEDDTPEDEFHSCSSSRSSSNSSMKDTLSGNSDESYQISGVSSSTSVTLEANGMPESNESYASPGVLAVEKMWEGFSVEDFSEALPCNMASDIRHSNRSNGRKEWTRRITVPKPFSMTVRKEKTMSTVMTEKESFEREAAAEVETVKQFRANPMPANTFLPLYDLINAKNEQRREVVKKLSTEALKSHLRPFKFSKREEEKKKQKFELLKHIEEQENKKKKEQRFKAKPVPVRLLDPVMIESEALEREEYRKIRIRMRAEKLLANAKPPYTMRLQDCAKKDSGDARTRGKSKEKGIKSHSCVFKNYNFHPKISHKIPDYDKAYCKFQEQMLKRKRSKITTVSEPFQLHTQKRAMVMKDKQAPGLAAVQSNISSLSKVKMCRSLSTAAPPSYPPQMTKTAKIREILTRERFVELEQKESLNEDALVEKKEQEKAVQKMVAQKSSVLDLTEMLEEKKKIKAQEFRLAKLLSMLL